MQQGETFNKEELGKTLGKNGHDQRAYEISKIKLGNCQSDMRLAELEYGKETSLKVLLLMILSTTNCSRQTRPRGRAILQGGTVLNSPFYLSQV